MKFKCDSIPGQLVLTVQWCGDIDDHKDGDDELNDDGAHYVYVFAESLQVTGPYPSGWKVSFLN